MSIDHTKPNLLDALGIDKEDLDARIESISDQGIQEDWHLSKVAEEIMNKLSKEELTFFAMSTITSYIQVKAQIYSEQHFKAIAKLIRDN